MEERIRQLIDIAGIDRLVKETGIGNTRWRTVRYDQRSKIRVDEAKALKEIFPEYAYWIMTGEIIPEAGQTSPAYDAAHKKLDRPAQA